MPTSNIIGAWYLHTNGELIWKNANCFITDEQYFDSPFVKKVWYLNNGFKREFIFDMLQEAHSLGADRKSILEICKDAYIDNSAFSKIMGEEYKPRKYHKSSHSTKRS